MGYWTGSGVEVYEIEQCVYCWTCDDDRNEMTVYVDGTMGTATCPICQTELDVEIDG